MTAHRIFFSLLLIFFPTQLGYHFWPDWAMVLGRWVDYLSPTLYLTDILILLTVGSYIIFNFQFSRRRQSGYGASATIFNQFSKNTILFFIFILINIFFAANQPVAVYKWLKVLEFAALVWYIVKTKPATAFVVFPLSIGVLYSSVLAIAQFFLQHSVGGPLWWLGERTFAVDTPGVARISWFGRELLRPYATFPHPNVLGGFLAATLPLLIFNLKFSIFNQTKKISIFKTITIIIGVTSLVLTFSRSAMVVGILAIVWILIKRKIAFFALFFAVVLFTFHFSLFTSSDESVVVRQQLKNAAIILWQQSPLVGVGLGNFLVELPKALPSRSVYFLQPVHNIFLLLLSEVGIVGLLIFLWILSRAIRIFNFQFSIFKLSLLLFLVLGLIDHYPFTLQQGQLLLTLFLALNYRTVDRTIRK